MHRIITTHGAPEKQLGSIEHVNISFNKYISYQAIDIHFWPDLAINLRNPHINHIEVQVNCNKVKLLTNLCVLKNCKSLWKEAFAESLMVIVHGVEYEEATGTPLLTQT